MGLIDMHGKRLKVSKNDLQGNVDDRIAVVYAAFTHVKYMNKYIIFSFEGEYNKKKLYVGSVHMKENSLVTFAVRPDELNYINKFLGDYMNHNVDPQEYEILDISNMEKIELVSFSEEDFDGLDYLDKMSIERVAPVVEPDGPKKPVMLYFLLVFFFLLLGGVTYLYINPDLLTVDLKQLTCTMTDYNKKVELNYTSNVVAKFDDNDQVVSMEKIDTYKFTDEEEYNDFKDNKKESTFFDIKGAYKYDDTSMELRLIYDENLVIVDYDEVYKYLKSKGYSCIEGIYNE